MNCPNSYEPEEEKPSIHDRQRYYFLQRISDDQHRKFSTVLLGGASLLFLLLIVGRVLKTVALPILIIPTLAWIALAYHEHRLARRAHSYCNYWLRQKSKRRFFENRGYRYEDIAEELDRKGLADPELEVPGALTIERGRFLFRELQWHERQARVLFCSILFIGVPVFYFALPSDPGYIAVFLIMSAGVATYRWAIIRKAAYTLEQWYEYYHFHVYNCPPLFELIRR